MQEATKFLDRNPSAGVLLVGALSNGALTGGVENGIWMLLHSELAARYNLHLFNTLRHRDAQRVLIQRVVYQLGQFGRYFLELLHRRPCLVHVKASEGINFFQGVGYCAIARLLRCRTLLQIHGGSFDSWYAGRNRLVKAAIRIGFRVPSELIALSNYWQTFLISLRPGRAVHIIPNGVEVEKAYPRRRSISPELQVLTIGSLGRRKGYYDIVAAAAQLRDKPIRFVFVGPDEFGGETEELQNQARQLNVQDHIEFRGTVAGGDKWKLLAEADLLLLPSYNENMPNAVLEAMAAGLPVVCTSTGALPEILEEGKGAIFVPPAAPAAIAKALLCLHGSPDKCRAMGRHNAAEVRNHFSFRHVVKALDTLYSKAMGL